MSPISNFLIMFMAVPYISTEHRYEDVRYGRWNRWWECRKGGMSTTSKPSFSHYAPLLHTFSDSHFLLCSTTLEACHNTPKRRNAIMILSTFHHESHCLQLQLFKLSDHVTMTNIMIMNHSPFLDSLLLLVSHLVPSSLRFLELWPAAALCWKISQHPTTSPAFDLALSYHCE